MRSGELRLGVDGSIVCASITGDIDLANAGALRAQINAAIPNHAAGLILDLSAVHYLDSAGIRFIYQLREDLLSSGQSLQLVIPSGSTIHATLRLSGLDWTQDTAENVDVARAALQR